MHPFEAAGYRPRGEAAGTWTGTWRSEFGSARSGAVSADLVQGPTGLAHTDAVIGTVGFAGACFQVTGSVRRVGGRVFVRAESDRHERPWLALDAVLEAGAGGGPEQCRGEFFLAGVTPDANEIGSVILRAG
jgi:hypothetical protein